MRVLLVANTLPPTDLSGVGEQVLQLAAGLRAAGHEVEILGRGPGGARGPKLLFPITVVPAFLRELRRFRPQVVQVHESDGALAALGLKILGATLAPEPLLVALLQVSYLEEIGAVRPLRADGRVVGRPSGVELRFKWFKAPLQVALGSLTAWLADLVLCPSRATAEEVTRDYGASRVQVLPNVTGGLDLGDIESPEREPGFFLFVGRLRIRKGVEILLHAIAALPKDSGVELLIVGSGEHGPRLERMATDLGLDGKVRFVGRQSAAGVRGLLASARALVVPSIYEGMPLVVLEAMEAGLPVVASAVSGIPEVVIAGETGWLVPPENAVRLAATLAEAYANPAEAERRGAAGRSRAARLYRPEAAAKIWIAAVGAVAPELRRE